MATGGAGAATGTAIGCAFGATCGAAGFTTGAGAWVLTTSGCTTGCTTGCTAVTAPTTRLLLLLLALLNGGCLVPTEIQSSISGAADQEAARSCVADLMIGSLETCRSILVVGATLIGPLSKTVEEAAPAALAAATFSCAWRTRAGGGLPMLPPM